MVTNRKAPESVMRDLCEAVRYCHSMYLPEDVKAKLETYRAATSPLRTRASVDADIVAEARAAFRDGHPHVPILFAAMSRLCSEPTDDHGSSSTPAAKESRGNAGVSAGPTNGLGTAKCHWCEKAALVRPHGRDNICEECFLRGQKPTEPLEDPEPCSCDESEALKRELRGCQASLASRTEEVRGACQKLMEIRIECEARIQHEKSSGDALYAVLEILDVP